MPAGTRSAVAMLTDFFAADDIEATARRTGFVQRTSKLTGKLFLALMTFGAWSEAKTTLAQLAAKATQLSQPVDISPEAIHQRMHKPAIAFLQDMIRQTLAKLSSLDPICDDGLFPSFTKVYIADSTGFALPEELHQTFPGAGGSAAKAGAKIQAVWDYKSSLFGHFALTPWNIPDQRYIDQVVALAQKGILFLFDLGYFKVKALASIALVGAYFLCRLNHQTNIYETATGRLGPIKLAEVLTAVAHDIPLLETSIFIGATERVAARLIAVRMPEAIVNERRRMARKNAKKKGYTPSQAHLTLMAWNLFITNVPPAIWPTATIVYVYPLRWQIELIFKSWKSYLHLASLTTKKEDPTLCYLYGRMLLILLNYALCPQIRATLWLKHKRELSLLKLVRHFQALAARWMQALFQSELELHRFLQRACAAAERLAAKAARKRQTTAQRLQEDLRQPLESIGFAVAVNA
jgi:Transposase DDE domain